MEENEDEEISIDFSKVKNIFSGRKGKKEKTEHSKIGQEEKKSEEEELGQAEEKVNRMIEEKKATVGELRKEKEHIEHLKEKAPEAEREADDDDTVDFSKLKTLFRKKEKHEEHHKREEEEEKVKPQQRREHEQEPEERHKEHHIEEKHTTEEKHKEHHVEEKHHVEQKPKEPQPSEEEEVSIDFTKIKRFFKGAKDKETQSSEEVSLDWRKIGSFFVKYQILFLILIPLIVSIQLRHIPLELPITDSWATSSVDNYFKSQIGQQIDKQYPNLPDANKQQLVASEFQKFLTEQKSMLDQQIQQTSQYFKAAMQDADGHTYLPDIDTYYWLRHARNVVNHGYPGDKIVNGQQIDDHMIAPLGRVMPGDMFHAYLMAYSFEFLRLFSSNLELDRVCFFMPIIFSALCIIPAFFIGRRFGGNFSGFVAALLVAIHPAFLVRSTGGVCDTDSYNVFFPLLITWLFIEAYESVTLIKIITLSSLAGFFVGLYSFTWGGWWFVFDFLLGAICLYVLYYLIVNRSQIRKGFGHFVSAPTLKHSLIAGGAFFLSALIFVSVFQNFAAFESGIFKGPRGFSQIKDVATGTVWPNVFTTVAEQNEVDFQGIISNMGGTLLFMISIFGIIVIAFVKQKDEKYNIMFAILLAIWFVSTIYASTLGVRWVLLLVPAFAIAIAAATGFVYNIFSGWIHKEFGINKYAAKIVMILLLLIIIFIYPKNMVVSAETTAKNEIPLITRAWVDALTQINQNSSKNAIVNSWWDYGHWFKYVADRPVTFDGTSQGTPMAHWIGKVLLTDNEDLAVGILQMLDCGSNKAFEELNKVIGEDYKSVDILYQVVEVDKQTARGILKKHGLTDSQADVVLYYTHCDPPEDYFIASDDMIGKSGVWAHFGSWDFRKATIFNKVRKMTQEQALQYLKDEFNYSTEDARSLYFKVSSLDIGRGANDWIAPWPSYASNLESCSQKGSVVQCGNGLEVDLSNYDAYLLTQQGKKHPEEIVVPTIDGLFRKKFGNDTIPYSAALIPSGDSFTSVLMQPELSASMFTRMFYMGGHNLSHFEPFTHQKSSLGTDVYVYKVNWQGGKANIMEDVKNQVKLRQQRHARHILVNTSEQANKIWNELKAGADFATLAKNYSMDSSAAKGGDIGWVQLGQTIAPFETALFNLSVGQISPPVKTQYGYHIIQLLGVRSQNLTAS